MAVKKQQEEWINSKVAAGILTKASGHTVSDAYVRRLGNSNKLTTKAIDGRTKLFLLSDVEGYTVKTRGTGEVRRAIREKKASKIAPDAQEASGKVAQAKG
jgi:hypothetical protein